MAVEREDRLARLIESGLALSAELSLPALLQRIVALAAELCGARYGALGVVGSDGTLVDFLTTGVTEEERRTIGPLPHGRGILGALIEDARPLRLRDIAADPRSVGFPAGHPPMHSFLGAPVRAHGRVFGNIYLTEKRSAEEFSAEDQETLVALATQAGVAVANARAYAEMERRERWLDSVREISGSLLAGTETDAVLTLVARRARELVRGDVASIVAPADTGGELVVRAADGALAERIRGMTVPRTGSVSGDVIATGRPLLLADASTDSRTYQPLVSTGEMGPMITTPLSVRGRNFGSLSVARAIGSALFHEEDVAVLETFAEQAALGLEYARVQAELTRLSVAGDRERIARDLHDGVIQSLFAVGLGLQGAVAMVDDERAALRVQDSVAEIDRVIGDLRGYIFELRPRILERSRLGEAIDQLAHDFEARTGVATAVDIDGSLEAGLAGHAEHLVHVVRELLSNVGRHAQATTCRVSLRRRGDAALLEVDDDGRGFDAGAASAPDSMGLGNVRRRAHALGGELTVSSTSGEGTVVRIVFPPDAATAP